MLDARFVIAHGLWIVGAAVALATFSYYDWLARQLETPLRKMLRVAWGWKAGIAGSALLVASGFLLMEKIPLWQRGLWLLVWAAAAVDMWRMRRANLAAKNEEHWWRVW